MTGANKKTKGRTKSCSKCHRELLEGKTYGGSPAISGTGLFKGMIEKVIDRKNLQRAVKHVVTNKGSAGVDGLTVGELSAYFVKHKGELVTCMFKGTYLPQPILGVEIPKGNGKTRLLGIPTVIDRALQQAVSQVLGEKFEPEFRDHSYGFRPGRNALQAVQQAQRNIHEGYTHIVDIDLQNFFDEVDHCLLLDLLYTKVRCSSTLTLIRRWLRSPMKMGGKLTKRRKGVPQGSPLSPLLSNILLNELDKELERHGLRYVRYADDFSIYTKSKSEARKVGNQIYLFLKDKLKLPINRAKSGIRKPVQFEILGYRFVPTYEKGVKGKYQLVVTEENWRTLKAKVREITRRTSPKTFGDRIRLINKVQRGWLNYFQLGSIQGKLRDFDGWVRNRLRNCIWKNWKRPERRRKNLIRLGVPPHHAFAWSRSRLGTWAIAQSPILTTTITLNRLAKRGYVSMMELYTMPQTL